MKTEMNPEVNAELLIKHLEYIEQKRRREEMEMSTEYGQLLKQNPGELQRILRDDPRRYEEMAKIHAITMTTNGKAGDKRNT